MDFRIPKASEDEEKGVHITDTIIKDSLGNSYIVRFKFQKSESDVNTWEVTVDSVIDLSDNSEIEPTSPIESINLEFDDYGKLTDTYSNEAILTISKDGVSFGGEDGNITIDFSQLPQYANEMDAKPYTLDGNTSGKLEGYAIDSSGVVVGIFTNGERKALAQIMLAKFDNPMGLSKYRR